MMASEIGSIQPNPYLFNIESRRKQKAKLAHEIGAGATCRKCKDKCSGFQLHFWRNVCLNCRCGKDDHEIKEVEEDIGKIVIGKLFDRPIRTKEQEQAYSYEIVNDSTGKKESLKFDWVPPGVGHTVAKKYMELLPPDKRPVVGSEAAKERRRLLEHQLPLYDVDESKRCEVLPPSELTNFLKYLDELRNHVAGQGTVQEISHPPLQSSGRSSLSSSSGFNTSPKAWSSPGQSPQHKESWDQKHLGPAPPVSTKDPNEVNSDAFRSLSLLGQNGNNCSYSPTPAISPMKSKSKLPSTYVDKQIATSIPSEALKSTRDNQFPKQIQDTGPLKPTQGIVPLGQTQDTGHLKGTSGAQFGHLPSMSPAKESKASVLQLTSPQPFMAKSEQQTRQKEQFSNKLVDSRSSLAKISPSKSSLGSSLEPQHRRFESYVESEPTMEDAIGIMPYSQPMTGNAKEAFGPAVPPPHALREEESGTPLFCQYCKLGLMSGDVAVICDRAGPGKYWHPQCFVCVTCNELLADLIYFYKDGQVFCGRHYTQAADIPRCKACDELIFGESWTRADGHDWHIHHFCCFICDRPLAGSKYVPDDRDYPHCLSCHMAFKAKMCETCENKITPEQARAGYNGYFFHGRPECFRCYGCETSLVGTKFKMVKNWLFCSQKCVQDSEEDIAQNCNPAKKV